MKAYFRPWTLLAISFFLFQSFLNAQTDLRKLVQGENGKSIAFTRLPEGQEINFRMSEIKALLQLDANSNLQLIRTEKDKLGFEHHRMQQTYRGIPVENSMYILHVKNNKLNGMSGNLVLEFDKQMPQSVVTVITKEQAINTALQNAKAETYAWQDADMEKEIKERTKDVNATYYPSTTLVWYSPGIEIDAHHLRLAYKTDVYSLKPLGRSYHYIDAMTGEVLGKKEMLHHVDATSTVQTAYSGQQTIHSNYSGFDYSLQDLTKGNGIITRRNSGTDITSTVSTFSTLTGTDVYGLDAHYGVSQTYDYYKTVYGRNSLDDNGYTLYSYITDYSAYDNAYWDGTTMHFGLRTSNGAGVTAIDVAGHELTHGLTQYTSELQYYYQSGAINESMSDIFGKTVQFWSKPNDVNWVLSNDMGWSIRNLSNPNDYQQPDTYLGTYWYTGSGDYGGVHYNSGVGNFMYYLLVTGGTGVNDIGNSYAVTGLGLTTAAAIIYRSQTVYLFSTAQYTDWRAACINAAIDLYGSNSNEVQQVQNAWYAVGIGATTGCTAPGSTSTTSIGASSATFNWTSVAGATGYNVQYRVVGAGTWTAVSTSSTSYTATGLTSGASYEWQVRTVCTSGTSAYTVSATFTTLSVCNMPTGMATLNITSTAATLSWPPVSGAASYNVQYRALGAANWSTTSTTTNSYNAAVLTPGTNYEWQVRTVCASGTSAYSASVNFTTLSSCSPPTGMSTINIAATTATFNWTAVSGATGYGVQYRVTGSANWITASTTSNFYNASALVQGASYEWQVRTVCTGGTNSGYTVSTYFGTLCSTPIGMSTASITGTSAIFNWSAVSGSNGYGVQYRLSGASTWTTATATTNSYPVSGLTPGRTYQWQVRNICSVGNSAYTSIVSFTTLCGAASGMTTTSITGTSATLNWSAAPGGINYIIQYRKTGTTTWTSGSTTGTSFNLSSLTAGTTYEWQVRTTCSIGNSSFTASTLFTTVAATCNVPANLSTANITATSAVLNWGAVSGATGYTFQYRVLGALTWITSSGTQASATISLLTPSTQYEWQVRTTCTGGTSAFSSSVLFTTAGTCIDITGGTGARMTTYYPTTNFNFTSYSMFDCWQWTKDGAAIEDRSILRFDLSAIPVGSTIVSATLSLYADTNASGSYPGQPTYGSNNASYLQMITSAWNPATVTWNTQPTVTTANQVLLAQSTNTAQNYLNINLAPFVQSWVNTPSANNGMLLKMITQNYYNAMIFCSPSYSVAGKRPRLQVCYSAATTCATPATTSTTSITTSTATFNWAAAVAATGYNVQYRIVGAANWTTATTTTNSYSASALTPGSNYEWQVRTVCTAGTSAYTASSIFATTSACAIPTGMLNSSITGVSVVFVWNSVAGATSYNVRYRVGGTSTWTTVSSAVNSVGVGGLTVNTSYEWQVQSVCSAGTSAYSGSLGVSTSPCNIPSGRSTTNVGATSARFSWGAVSGASGYVVEYKPTAASTWTVSTSAPNPYNAIGLTPGTNYEWRLYSICSVGGTSPYTGSDYFTTLTACTVPTGMSTTSITTTSATLNWAAVSGAVGYRVQYRKTGTSTWSALSVASTSASVSALTAATSYEWQVRTICSTDSSAYTGSTTFTTLSLPCTVPTNMSTTSITTTGATFNWAAVSGAVSYRVQYRKTGTSTWSALSVASTSASVSALTAATSYEWQVRTICSTDSSAYTSSTTFTTLSLPCTVPTGMSTTSITTTSATLNWTAVSGAVSYRVQYRETGTSTWSALSVATTSASVSALTAATSYEWQVRTICSGDSSVFSASTNFSTLTPCGTPSGLKVQVIDFITRRLIWDSVPGATSYNYRYRIVGAASFISSSRIQTSVTLNLEPGLYEWQVQAVCNSGTSAYTALSTFSFLSCDPPYNLSVKDITDTKATLVWSPGVIGVAYPYRYRIVDTGNTWTGGGYGDSIGAVLTGLIPGTTYEWESYTQCYGGGNVYSSVVYGGRFSTSLSCTVPTGMTTTSITTTSATLNWAAVSGAVSYRVQYRKTGTSTWSALSVASTSASVSALTAATSYEWQVRTICSTDSSAYTSSTTFTTLSLPCTVPTGMSTTSITTTSATLNWAGVSGAVSYRVQYRKTGTATWSALSVASTSASVSALTAATGYEWQVRTICTTDSSAYTSSTTFTTLSLPCTVPTGMSTSNIAATTATFTWVAVAGATGYNVRYRWAGSSGAWTTGSTATNLFNATQLENGFTYEWAVQTVCATGTSSFTGVTVFTTLCSAPTNMLTIDITETTAILTWSVNNNSGSSTARYREVGDTTWNIGTGIPGGTWGLTNLKPNTSYEWQVQAICSNPSVFTPLIVFTTRAAQSPCGVATSLYAFPVYNNLAQFSWAPATNASSYTLQYRLFGTPGWISIVGADNTGTQVTGLTAATKYEWRVKTNCVSGDSAFSSILPFTTLQPCPSATGLVTETVYENSAVVKWNALSGVSSYEVRYRPTGTTTWTVMGTATASTSLSPLQPGTTYEWQLRNFCDSGSSNYSSSLVFTTLNVCNLPSALNTTNITATAATFNWTAATYGIRYVVKYRVRGTSTVITDTVTGTSYTATNLVPGTLYAWQIITLCNGNYSGFSIDVNFNTLCNVPSGLSTTNISATGVTFNWAAIAGVTGYRVQYRPTGSSTWLTAPATTNSYTASALNPSTSYEWQVKTRCASDSSGYSSSVVFTTLSTCSAPTGPAAVTVGSTSASLSWAGAGANSYILQYKTAAASTWTTVNVATSFYNLSGLVACTPYQFAVQAVCSGGTSPLSATASFTTTGCTSPYCASKASMTTFEYIKNVTLGTINNTTGASNGYADFTALSTTLTGGSAVTISVTPGYPSSITTEFFTVYIDYNKNNTFTDAGEMVAQLTGTTAVSKSFTVPTTALNGPTRMRVQMQYSAYLTNPCANYTFGEVEDYTVIIAGNAGLRSEITGIEGEQEEERIVTRLYPNPAHNYLTIEFGGEDGGQLFYNVYNMNGQRVIDGETSTTHGVNLLTLDVGTLPNGIYILQLDRAGTIERRRFIVTK